MGPTMLKFLSGMLLGTLLMAGCGRFEVSIQRVDEPNEPEATRSAQVDVLAVTSTPIPFMPGAGSSTALPPTAIAPADLVPTVIPAVETATPVGAIPTAIMPLNATFEDAVAGIALGYSTGWEIYELDDAQKASASTYATTFQSWIAGPGGGNMPAGGVKIDLVVYPNRGRTLEEAVTLRRTEIESPDSETTLLSEEPVMLVSGMEGVRMRTNSIFGESSQVVTVANGHLIIFSGTGDGVLLNQILQTLRPLDIETDTSAATAQAPSTTDVRAIRVVESVRVATVVSGPTQDASPVAQIPGGMTVAVSGISDDGGWYQLAGCGEQNPYRPAPDCWLSADQSVAQPVRPIAPSQQPVLDSDTASVVIMAQNMANVRSGPGTDYAVISQLAGGFTFPVIGVSEDGGWWRLNECSSPLNEVLEECWISADPAITGAVETAGIGGQAAPGQQPTAVPQRSGSVVLEELPICFNLDDGTVGDVESGSPDPLCEFTLRAADSAGTLIFEPVQPARFGFGGVFPEVPSVSMCSGSQHLSGGSETIAPLASMYVCYQTGEGRFGYLHFVDMRDDPLTVTMEWETFE